MGFSDKYLKCKDCHADFIFTVREQEFFASKGFTNDPKHCALCRFKRRNGGADPSAKRERDSRREDRRR